MSMSDEQRRQIADRAKAKFDQHEHRRRERCKAMGIPEDYWDQTEVLQAAGYDIDNTLVSMDDVDEEVRALRRLEMLHASQRPDPQSMEVRAKRVADQLDGVERWTFEKIADAGGDWVDFLDINPGVKSASITRTIKRIRTKLDEFDPAMTIEISTERARLSL